MPDRHYTGGCLCGAVHYQYSKPMQGVVNCHCSQCRRTHGHVGAYVNTLNENLELLEDRGLKWFRASDTARRGFCKECGATLFWDGDDDNRIEIAAGTLDGPTDLKTTAHIFVADKGDYYELDDGLPQHQQGMHAL